MSFLSFHWVHHACGCLLHSSPVEEEGISLTKDDPTSRAHQPPGPCAFASYGPQSSEQTSVLLWKQPLISERRLAVKLMKNGIITSTEMETVKTFFSVIDQACKCWVKDDSFLRPLPVSLSHQIDAFEVCGDPNLASVTVEILHNATHW